MAETQKNEVDVKPNIVQTQNKSLTLVQPAPVIQQAQPQTTTLVDHVGIIQPINVERKYINRVIQFQKPPPALVQQSPPPNPPSQAAIVGLDPSKIVPIQIT